MAKTDNRLDIKMVLNAIDRKDYSFYSRLSDEDKKKYTPLVLMKLMSSLPNNNDYCKYAILATNDLVNVGLFNLHRHPELQHLLLCVTGMGSPQYRLWVPMVKSKKSVTGAIAKFMETHYPDLNDDEIEIILTSFDTEKWTEFVKGAGLSDPETKELITAWKKLKI